MYGRNTDNLKIIFLAIQKNLKRIWKIFYFIEIVQEQNLNIFFFKLTILLIKEINILTET